MSHPPNVQNGAGPGFLAPVPENKNVAHFQARDFRLIEKIAYVAALMINIIMLGVFVAGAIEGAAVIITVLSAYAFVGVVRLIVSIAENYLVGA